MSTYLLFATATDAGRPLLGLDTTWLDHHRATMQRFNTALIGFYFTTSSIDVLFVIDALDDMTVTKLALALTGHGVFRIETARAYPEDEYRALLTPPVPPLHTVADLTTLRMHTQGLFEHHTDSKTVHLDDYGSMIIRTGGHPSENPVADIGMGMGEEVTLKFAESLPALGFTYQQGLWNATFEVSVTDGTVAEFSGSGFIPMQNFFGVVAQAGIDGVRIRTQGSFYLQDFYFYAARQIEPQAHAS